MSNRKADPVRQAEERGISLIETAIICLIIATLMAVAIPMFQKAISNYNLRNAADHVAQRLSAARALAMAKNRPVTISINRATGVYGYDFSDPADGIPDTADPSDPSTSYFVESLPSEIFFVFPSGNDYVVTFNSRGEVPIGATAQSIPLTNGRQIKSVQVNLRGNVWVQ